MYELRLNKVLAAAGVCSRRKADELIQSGMVKVNGKIVTELGLRVNPDQDEIIVQGQKLPQQAASSQEKIYIMLHKPIQVVSTASDPEKRTTVLDILPSEVKNQRIYPVGRLDYFSEGLLLLTNDGELTHRLTHPRYHIPKNYEVLLREVPNQTMLDIMQRGMTLQDGTRLSPVEVLQAQDNPKLLQLALHQGINRQIRRMCQDLKLTILKLRRMSIGDIELGALPYGKSRKLTKPEVEWLKKSVGLV